LETKRYIGNDTTRIFARVRRELGPDAVIVRTRSLLRDGAEPLIEVLAASPSPGTGFPPGVQQALIEGALAHVEYDGRPLTVGDLEDLAAREAAPAALPAPTPPQREPAPPAWLQGFVTAPATDAVAYPFPTPEAAPPPAPVEWSPRPRILTREPAASPAFDPSTPARRFAPVEPGAPGLLTAGLTPGAARIVSSAAPDASNPVSALESALAASEAAYPVEGRTALITIQGAPGAGRTTALMRMALDCADAGRPAMLVAGDTSHTGGPAQVHAYAEAIGIPARDAFSHQELVAAVAAAPRGACIFVDVPPGRWAPPALPGIDHFAYLAIPAHWDPGVLAEQLAPFDSRGFAGAVLTHGDIATSLAPALSIVLESALGIAFLSSGRDVAEGIEVADPRTLASGVFTTSSRERTNGRLVASA